MQVQMRKYALTLRAGLAVVVVLALKLGAHYCGWEWLSLNPLFSGVVAANVFLMGFLLSGVLTDYKESERLPGELAGSLEALIDEGKSALHKVKSLEAQGYLRHVIFLTTAVHEWFYRREKTRSLMQRLADLNPHFVALEKHIPANYIARLKQEQSVVRRLMIRAHTIRETSFISSGYRIAEWTTLFLVLGLIMVRIDPFYEALFVVGIITFLLTYLIFLIHDLDNPFGYTDSDSAEDVSLKPISDLIERDSEGTMDTRT